jgi:hypothetical protein
MIEKFEVEQAAESKGENENTSQIPENLEWLDITKTPLDASEDYWAWLKRYKLRKDWEKTIFLI